MKKFILNSFIFICLLLLSICLLLILPPTPRSKNALIFAEIKKDSLLINTEQPRIIFVGGSNVSFGLDSQKIKDLLNINPINTAIIYSLGLKYMLDNTYQYIKKGDIVVLMPEYQHFFQEFDFGSEELLRTVIDVNKSKIKLLNCKQILACSPFIPKLISSKFKISEYKYKRKESLVYPVDLFNMYGDFYTHWDSDKMNPDVYYVHDVLNENQYNHKTMKKLKKYEEMYNKKGAKFYISYPSLQETYFNNNIEAINKVEKELIEFNFIKLGNPERYRMNDFLMYDTVYHLNKKGVDIRTQLLIEDLKDVHNDFVQ